MKANLILIAVIISAILFSFVLACSDEDDSEAGGISVGDDDDDDDDGGNNGEIGTNECGSYGDSGCTDSDDRACESAYLANENRFEHPEESACAPNLKWSEELAQVAYEHSKDMCEREFFEHENPDGKSPFDRMDDAGINWFAAAENIAAGTGLTAEQADGLWMDEPQCVQNHRSTILSRNLTHIGVGVYDCPDGWVYITQDYASFSQDDVHLDDHPYCGPGF